MASPTAPTEKKTSIDEAALHKGSDGLGSRLAQSDEILNVNDRALAEQYGYQPVSSVNRSQVSARPFS